MAADLDILAVANFLAKKLPATEAVEQGQAFVKAFAGKKLIQFLISSKKAGLDAIGTEEQAVALAQRLLDSAEPTCFHAVRVTDVVGSKITVAATEPRPFSPAVDAFYAWTYKGSQTWNHMLLGIILLIVLLGCLFPIWPRWAKLGALVVAAGLLALIVGLLLIRGLLAFVTWLVGYQLWIFPYVFEADDFTLYSLEPTSKSDRWYRLAAILLIAGAGYWIYTQPDRFQAWVEAQQDFVTGLYSGAFVADVSEDQRQFMEEEGGEGQRRRRPRSAREEAESLFDDILGKAKPRRPKPQEEPGQEPDADADALYDFDEGLDQFLDDDDAGGTGGTGGTQPPEAEREDL